MLVPLLLLPLAGAPTGPTVVHFDPAQPPAGAPELEEGSTIVPRRKSYRKAHWWSIKARRVDLSSGERYASNDWLTNFLSMPRSHVLERIGSHLWGQIAICTAVVVLDKAGFHFPRKSSLPHQLLGGVLALLLAFRTNMAYSRFWLAREKWGISSSSCRDLALYVVAHVRPRSPELAAQLVALIAAFPLALAHRCSGDTSAKLPPGVAAIPRIRSPEYTLAGPDFTGATTPPAALAICLELRFVLAEVARRNARRLPEVEAQVEAEMLMQASRRVGNLVDALGSCESLLTTPVPLSYSRHTSRFLTIWCATLPVVLVDTLGFITIPAVAFIGWCLFGIEEIGHLIEQPFRDEQELGTAPALVSRRRFFSYGLPVRRLGRLASEQVHAIAATAPPAPQKRRPWWRLSL